MNDLLIIVPILMISSFCLGGLVTIWIYERNEKNES